MGVAEGLSMRRYSALAVAGHETVSDSPLEAAATPVAHSVPPVSALLADRYTSTPASLWRITNEVV